MHINSTDEMTAGNINEEFVPLEDCPNEQDGTDDRIGTAATIAMTATPAARPTTLNVNENPDNNPDVVDFRTVDNGRDETDNSSNNNNNNSPSRNVFADRQNVVRGLCDASLMAANVSQLRAVLDGDPGNKYFIPLLIMIGLSLLSHMVFGLLMIQRWRKERKAEMEHRRDVEKAAGTPVSTASNPRGVTCFCDWCVSVEWYDEVSMFFMFFVIILNVAIAGLGLTSN